MRSWLRGVPLVLLAATDLAAQEQTASIVGVVRDASGGVVPGAVVTAGSDGGLAIRRETDDAGRYRFPALAPGVFDVTAELAGFAPAAVQGVDLRLGQRLDVNLTLSQAALSESVSVVAEAPLIAITQSARATSLRQDEIQRLPNGRDFTDVVVQVPGANLEVDKMPLSPVSVDGSSGGENRFIIDGAESTDLVFGVSSRPAVTDFLDEVQVKSSGYTPEYGGSTGGVINALTRSGTNTWHGEALLYWAADRLDAGNRPTLQLDPLDVSRAEYVTFPKDDYHAVEPGFTLGGPILRDRLWFFAGYLPRLEPVTRTAAFNDGTTGSTRQKETIHNLAASVNGELAPAWRFRAAFNQGRVRTEGLLHEPNGTSPPGGAYDQTFVYPGWSLSGSVDWNPSPSLYSSLRAAYSLRDTYSEGVYEGDLLFWATPSVGLPGVPPEYQRPGGFQNVPNNWAVDRERSGRLNAQWDATVFFQAAGRHQLKAGIQLDGRTIDVLQGNTGNAHALVWDRSFIGQRGRYGYYQVLSNPVIPNRGNLVLGEARVDSFGLFVQDAWTVGDRLTLNLGLRTENEHLPSFSRDPAIPETALRFGFGDKLAPRLGFAWDPTGDGKTKLYGSWGRFYDIMKLRLPAGFGAQFLSLYWFTLDSADVPEIENNPACPPECPGSLLLHQDVLPGRPINDPNNPEISLDPDLEPMRLQEAVIGVEQALGTQLSVSARYVHKQLDRAVEDAGFLTEEGSLARIVANPGFGVVSSFVPEGGTEPLPYPRARRDYDALELSLHRRMANGWTGRFSYLWSRLHGNYSGLASSDFLAANPNFNPAFNSPMMSFDDDGQAVYGPLGTDRTHQLKAQFVRDFDFGTTVGASWYAASGTPVTRWARYKPGFDFRVFYDGRESDGRTPFTSRLDLQLQHRIHLGDRARLTLTATAFNVFNQGRPTAVFSRQLFEDQAIAISEAEFLSGVDTRSLIEEQGLAVDPRFLMDRAFQAPRTIRLAVRWSF